MNYKRLIYLNIAILFLTSLVVLYNIFTPKLVESEPIYVKESTLSIENLESYVLSLNNSSNVYVILGDANDQNTIYLLETVLKNCANKANVDYFNTIEFVQVNPSLTNQSLITNTYYVNELPSFVSLENDNNEMVVTSTLSWSSEEPIKEKDIQEWMEMNNIWPK